MYLIFVSSLNQNMSLASKIQDKLKEENKNSEIINLVELNLPMYDTKKEETDGIPSEIEPLLEKMRNASGYIFVTAEYNFSLPPVLVNFVAWVSRIGDDFRALFTLKYVQLATFSGGGGTDVLNAMRTQFTKLGSIVMPREILSTYATPVEDESIKKVLGQFLDISKKD